MDQNVQNNLDTDVSSLDQLAARISTLRQTESPTSIKINTPGSSAGLSTINASSAQDFDNFLNGLNNQAYDPLKFNRVSNSAFQPLLRYRLNPEYDSQGYNPFSDNEAVYNTNTTWVSDMGRASKLILPAIGDFAWETMTNYDLTDWSSDIEGAKEYSDKMDLMMSSRGGAGGFAVNLYAQLAPTLGVLAGIGAEQVIAKGLEFGASRFPGLQGLAPVAEGLEANSARQLFKLPKLVSSLGKAKDSFNAFRTLDSAAKIRSIYTGAAKGGMSLIKGINPLSNTFKAYQNIRSGAAGVALAGDMAKLYKTAGGLWRDVQNYRVVLNEANLEGGLAINEHIKNKREEYIKTYGYEPMGDDAYAIYEEAQAIGNATQMINMGIIHLTNSFGFNRLVDKAISPRAAAAKTFAEKFNAYIVETGAKGAGKASYKLLENNFKKWGSKAYYKHMLTSAPSGLLSYFGNNLMEGTQELLQESIVNGVTHYYDNMYTDPIKFHKATMGESIKYGLGSQLDAKGAEVFLSGFLTGGAANVVTAPMLSVFTKANKIIDPEGYKKALELSNEQKNRILTSANYVADNRQEFFSMLDKRAGEQLNYARSGEIAQALGDEKTARDIKDGATFSHVYNLYKAGRVDIIKDQLNGLLELEDNELADSLNETVQGDYGYANLRDRVKTTMKRVDNIQKTVDKINDVYENPYQPWEINKKVNPDKFNEEYAKWDAYEDAKYFAAFATDSYSRAVERMYSITNEMSSSPVFQNTAGMGVGRMFSVNQLQDDASNLRTQAKIYRENNESTKANELEERANRYDNLAKNSNLYSKFLQFVGKSETLNAEEARDLEKVKEKLVEQGINVEDLTLDNVDDIEALLKDSFNEYVKDLAKDNPSALLDSNLDEVFAPYRDWHKLGDDTTVMAKWVNHLSDPAGFNRVQDTIKTAKDEVYANRKRILKEQKDRYMKGLIKDKLLKDLYAIGVMVSKEDEDAFLNEKRYPNLVDAKTMEPIKSNDPRIANIIDIFDQYEELNDVLVNDKPIYDASTETILANSLTDAAGRTKSEKDTRTYSDFVEALGIDNTKDEQEVEISTLYDYILDSKFSTPAEKKLVQRIKDKYKKAKITISKNHNAPISYDETNGLIIDLRYASDEYKAGKMRSEFLMLKGIMTAMTFNFLESDSKFETEVEEMRNAVKEAVSKNSDLLAEYNGRIPRALESNKDFINDIMTNSLFQGVASRIKSTKETKKSVYADFIKSIKQFIGKLLGIKTTRSSILDQAVNLVGSKIQDTDYTKPFKKEKPKAEKKADEAPEEGAEEVSEEDAIDAINQKVSIKDMPQSLVDILDAEFKKVISLSDAPYTKTGFTKFVATSPKAASLIEKWKKSEKARLKKEAEESTKKKETKKKKVEKVEDDEEPVELTDDDKEALYELGYSRSDINGMGELAAEVLAEKMARDENPMFAVAEGDFAEADKKVADLRKKVLERNLQLTADQKQYEPKNKKKAKEEGKPLLYRRISELLGKDSDSINPVSAERGNVTDEIYRDFMGGRINSIPELRTALEKASAKKGLFKYNDDFVVDLYDTMQFIRDYLTNAGFKIVADFPTLSGDIGGPIAGTIDFLIYDEEGNISFIDLKTSTANLRKKYANPEKDEYQYKVGHTIQQNGYRELFKQQTGESVDNLLILPLQIFSNRAGIHTGIKLEGAENDKGDMTYTLPISTARDIYQLTGIGKGKVTEKPVTTEKTTQQAIDDLRAREQVELRNAIPNIESYKDAEGNLDKSKFSPLELQFYNEIYGKYDKLISPLIADAKADIERRRQEDLFTKKGEDNKFGFVEGLIKNMPEVVLDIINFAKAGLVAESISDELNKLHPSSFPFTREDVKEVRNYLGIPRNGVSAMSAGLLPMDMGYEKEELEKAKTVFKEWVESIDKINARYNEELAALEGKPAAKPATTTKDTEVKGFKLSIDKKGKDQGKADLANRFIGYGVKGTSTYQYEQDAIKAGIPINYEGKIDKNTVAFVSVNGNNKADKNAIFETIENAREVLENGGTVIMDSTEDANRSWNKKGEALVQEGIGKPTGQTSKGYNYWGSNPEAIKETLKTKAPKTKTEKKAATKEKIEKTKVEKKAKAPTPKKSTAKTKEELTKERDDLIKPLEDEKAELGRILETEQSKRLVRDTVNNEITPEEMTSLQEELGTSEEGVKAQVVSEVINQMNDKKPTRAKTLLQKVAKRIKRILLNVMIGTVLFNSMSFTYNPKAQVLTYQTVDVENLESFDSALLDQEATNKLDNLNIITKSFEDSNEAYLIVDKPNALAHLFQGDSLIDTFEVGTGRKVGDAQTKTVIKNGKVLWEQGNQQTGAGIYTVGGIGKYKSSPSYTLKNEEGIEVPTVLHETLEDRKKLFADNDVSNNRMSFGCVNFKAESLNKLGSYTNFNAGSKVFVLPDDSTNKFQIIDGDLRFISQDTNVNRTIKGYTAQPIAIKAGKESREVNTFVNAIANNKAELMRLYPTISNATYNQIATVAYGIMGQESSFGTFGGLRGQYGKSRDDAQVMMGYGVPSVGVTQIRFTSVNNKIKDAFGITKQEDIKDNVDKAAIATMGVLLDVYENEIPANLKQDFRSLLPLAYSNRTEFAKALKGDTSTYDNQYVKNVTNYSEGVEVYQGVASETTKEEKSEKAPIQTAAVGLIGLAALYRRRQESGEALSDVDLQGIQDQINDINKEISRIKTEYNSKIRGALSESRKKAEDITKETEKEPTFVSKGDVIKMADGSIVQVTKVSKNKIEVVPYMQQDGDTMIINQEDMDQGKAIVVKPGQKVEAQEVTPEDTEMLTESVSSANTIANDKENQLAVANKAESQTSTERVSSFKDKLKNRCKSK
jgi:hypothetical protein